jgi:hypothetical protein
MIADGYLPDGRIPLGPLPPKTFDPYREELPKPPPQVPQLPSALGVQEGGQHYKKAVIQPIEYIHANGIPFAEGSVIKYVSRWRDKGGIEDLKKARHFIDLLIELETKKK